MYARDLMRREVVTLEAADKLDLAEGVMTSPVFTVTPSISLRAAVRIMIEKRIGCLPVVEDGKLVGLLSESDCLTHLAHLLEIAEEKNGLPELAPAG